MHAARDRHLLLVCALLLACVACDDGADARPDDTVDADTLPADLLDADVDGVDDTRDTLAPDLGPVADRLELPMVPVDRGLLLPTGPIELDESGAAPVLRGTFGATLVAGEGYPADVAFELALAYTTCGALDGTLMLDDLVVSPANEGIDLELVGDHEVRVLGGAPGFGSATVRGRFVSVAPAPCGVTGSEIDVELELHVDSRAIARVEVDAPYPCTPDDLVVAVGSTPGLLLSLYDADGNAIYPSNAGRGREVDVVIESSVALPVPEPSAELAEVTMPADEALVVVTPTHGSASVVEVVDAGRVTNAEVEFSLAGYAAGWTSLASGEHYDTFGARKANRIVPTVSGVQVGERVLCGGPAPSWFTLTSATPEVCEVRPISPGSGASLDSLVLPGGHVDLSAWLHADGACDLTLTAPGFASGQGFEARLSATFADVELLSDVP